MSAPICPYCGDGMESIGTLNHIECATKLLAEVERLRQQLVDLSDDMAGRIVEAEAEVERLKGQDCASCSHTKQDTALYPPPPPNYEVYSYCGCPDSPCYMRVITPVDRCAHWSARLTQGSKEAQP